MSSLEDTAAIQIGVKICNNSQLKTEIFRLPGSEYHKNEKTISTNLEIKWNKVLEKKAAMILENLGQPKQIQENIACIIPAIGRRILHWAEYHEETLGYTRNFSFNVYNSSFFTLRGIVDWKKAAEEMMKDKKILSIKQKYKLALLYCMNDHIPDLYTQLTEKDKGEFYDSQDPYNIRQTEFVRFWSYYLKNEVDKLREDADPNLCWLQMAVRSGVKDVVEYCLEETNLISDEGAVMYAALETVRCIQNWFIKWGASQEQYECYLDVVCFLFSKMSKEQQIIFLKEDIKGVHYTDNDDNYESSTVLPLFLHWPYQDYFMKIARMLFDYLPVSDYSVLIDNILNRIGTLESIYGEDKSYNYRTLLSEFWKEIPGRNKSEILRDQTGSKLNVGKQMLFQIFTLKNFTYQDKINIRLILHDATAEEKDDIIFSKVGKNICTELIALRKWEMLDEFIVNCCASKERIEKFKKEFYSIKETCRICIKFIEYNEWEACDSFITWSTLSKEEIIQLKEEILSEYGRDICGRVISFEEKLTALERVIVWCSLPEDKITPFKKGLLFCYNGMHTFANLVVTGQIELANEFINWGLSSEEHIKQYKKDVINEIGIYTCATLISDVSINEVFESNYRVSRTIEFNGGKWEEVEKFLTLCFSSEDEISDFKNCLTEKDSDDSWIHLTQIHLHLILAHKWEDAKILFAWLGLSCKEIKELKKETIFSARCMSELNVSVEDNNLDNFLVYPGGKWEEIELLLRWCLTDEGDVLEFWNRFDEEYGSKNYADSGENVPGDRMNNLNRFHLLISEFINDLFNNRKNTGRRSEHLS